MPDALNQVSGSIGGPIVKDKTFFFATGRLHAAGSDDVPLAARCRRSCCRRTATSTYVGHYRQALFNGRLDHKLTPTQTLMVRVNVDRFYDTNPQDAVGGTSAPSVARRYTRGSWTAQVNHTSVLGSNLLNEARFAYLNGDPVTLWEAQTLSTTYTRAGSVPFTIGQSRVADLFGHQAQFSDTLSWSRGKHYLRFGGSVDPSHLRRHGQRARARRSSARSRSSTRRPRRSIS